MNNWKNDKYRECNTKYRSLNYRVTEGFFYNEPNTTAVVHSKLCVKKNYEWHVRAFYIVIFNLYYILINILYYLYSLTRWYNIILLL